MQGEERAISKCCDLRGISRFKATDGHNSKSDVIDFIQIDLIFDNINLSVRKDQSKANMCDEYLNEKKMNAKNVEWKFTNQDLEIGMCQDLNQGCYLQMCKQIPSR